MLSSCSQIRPLMMYSWACLLLPGAMARGGRSRATKSTTRSIMTAQWAEYRGPSTHLSPHHVSILFPSTGAATYYYYYF